MESFTAVFQELGYVICDDDKLEDGFEKVALYEAEGLGFQHVSHQLPDGRWASKLGPDEDIEHNSLEALESDDYGSPSVFLKRATNRSKLILSTPTDARSQMRRGVFAFGGTGRR